MKNINTNKLLDIQEKTRLCTYCAKIKPIEDFEIRKRYNDGTVKRGTRCKECKNLYEKLRIKKINGEEITDDELDKCRKNKKNIKTIKKQDIKRKVIKRKNKSFNIDEDLCEKLALIKNQTELINMLIRNHFGGFR